MFVQQGTRVTKPLTPSFSPEYWVEGKGCCIAAARHRIFLECSPGSFRGEWVDSGSVLVAITVIGDASLDGTVNSTDFNLLAAHYGQTEHARWTQGDFDGDGRVSTLDFNLLAGNFSHSASQYAALGSVVPEPSSLLVFVVGVGLGMQRRRS